MKKIYTLAFAILFSTGLFAQNVTKKAVFTTGGSYGAPANHVKIYTYDVNDSSTIIIDSIPGDFSNHVVSDGQFAYVHVGRGFGHPNGGDRIFKYDLLDLTGSPIDSTAEILGIQYFEIGGNKLVVARGFPVNSEFFFVIDKHDLQNVLHIDTESQTACNGIAIHEDVAYIASTSLNDTGVIHVMQLEPTEMYSGKILLDTLSAGAAKLFYDNQQLILTHQRYTPNYDIWYAGVSTIQLSDSSFVSDTTGFTQSMGFDYFSGNLMGDFGNGIENYEISTGIRSPFIMTWATAAKKDPNADRYYLQTTDYFSFGQVEVYDEFGVGVDTAFSDVGGSALNMVTNNFPVAVNDTISGGAMQPSDQLFFEPLLNDFDIDGDSLTLDSILNQPNGGTVYIMGDYIVLSNASQLIDSVFYVVSDVWGDSDTAMLFYQLIGSVSEIKNLKSKVYPNPTHDFITVQVPNQSTNHLQVFNTNGQLVYSVFENKLSSTIDVSWLAKGVYYVKISNDNLVDTHKVIIY